MTLPMHRRSVQGMFVADSPDHHCHCEERSDVVTEGNACGAISWYKVRICRPYQEIAAGFRPRDDMEVGSWCFCFARVGA